jgi:3'-5' exoribonuclease
MTAQMIREKALTLKGFPRELEWHLTHLVLAHHGQLEYGSPKLPVTLEAQIVHAIDSLDSRIASWLELMAKDPGEKWTAPSKLYDRHLWKGTLPTQRNKGPVAPRKKADRAEKPERTERTERPERAKKPRKDEGARESREPAKEPKSELTFKPLEALLPTLQAQQAEAKPGPQAAAPAQPESTSPSSESASE